MLIMKSSPRRSGRFGLIVACVVSFGLVFVGCGQPGIHIDRVALGRVMYQLHAQENTVKDLSPDPTGKSSSMILHGCSRPDGGAVDQPNLARFWHVSQGEGSVVSQSVRAQLLQLGWHDNSSPSSVAADVVHLGRASGELMLTAEISVDPASSTEADVLLDIRVASVTPCS